MSASLFASESERLAHFPVAKNHIFLGHAGVTILPACAAKAMADYAHISCTQHQEFGEVLRDITRTREICADFIGADSREIALLGPTSLGLSIFANGIDWNSGDELLCYQDDYPANVYPWLNLQKRGVQVRYVRPSAPGQITPELVAENLTPKTRLVALASCHFLSGWKLDVDAIGEMLHARGILFSVDGIQTVGALPFSVKHVDFMSADAHKWMLGPMAIGIVYVAREHFKTCHPTLLGAWNVKSPEFVTQDTMDFPDSAQRYEPGVLNTSGIYGMKASLEMLASVGMDRVTKQILFLHDYLLEKLLAMGFQTISPFPGDKSATGIVTVFHPHRNADEIFETLRAKNITASLRRDRSGTAYLRFSPHFYNTQKEMDAVLSCVRGR